MRYKGSNLDEALELASKEEYVDKADLAYEVVVEEENNVEIEVFTIVDVIEYSQNYLKEALEALGVEAKVTPSIKDDIIRLKIDSDHNPILIGKNGTTLQSLNELTRIAISNHFKHRYRVLLDINGYKDDKITQDLKERHIRYKEQWDTIANLEKQGKAIVLRPHKDLGVTRYTTDPKKLGPWFQLGYDETLERIDEIKEFVK